MPDSRSTEGCVSMFFVVTQWTMSPYDFGTAIQYAKAEYPLYLHCAFTFREPSSTVSVRPTYDFLKDPHRGFTISLAIVEWLAAPDRKGSDVVVCLNRECWL